MAWPGGAAASHGRASLGPPPLTNGDTEAQGGEGRVQGLAQQLRVCELAQRLAGHVASGRSLGVPGVHVVPACPLSWAPSPQMTYSLTRFAIYETVRDQVAKGSQGPLPFYKKVLLGSISGEWPVGGRGWWRGKHYAW